VFSIENSQKKTGNDIHTRGVSLFFPPKNEEKERERGKKESKYPWEGGRVGNYT